MTSIVLPAFRGIAASGKLVAPAGFVFLIDNDGAYLIDNDGAYLITAI